MNKIDRQIKNGILPKELNYSLDNGVIDWDKLQYNKRYHTFDFHAQRFPKEWADNPLFIPVIEHLAEQAKLNNISPLEELNKIYNNSIENNVVSDSPQ